MIQRAVKEVNAEFPAEEKYLDNIKRTAQESCTTAGMSSKDKGAVLLAIEEGATNIIRHAYLYEKGTLRLRIVIYKKFVVFSLIDYGRSFKPGEKGKIDLEYLVESGRKGGLGFMLIQKIMDSVEYIASAEYNELRMIKRIGQPRSNTTLMLKRMFSLRAKFSLWTFIIVAVIIGGAYYYIDYRTSKYFYSHLDEKVHSLAKTIADQAVGYVLNSRSDVEFDELIVSYMRANPELTLIVLTDSQGNILAHSEDIRNIKKHYTVPDYIDKDLPNYPQTFSTEDDDGRYLIMPMKSGTANIGEVHISYSSWKLSEKLSTARQKIMFLTGILLLFGILGIYILSSYFVSPIVKITQRVRRFTSGDLESELPLEGAAEFFEISKAFNEMITRLSQDQKNVIAREKMAKEIEVASHIQKTLLPGKLPEIPGLEVDAFYRAASIIGGDLYDIFAVDEERYCLVVADVSGKGVPASLVMSMLRTVIQILAGHETSSRAMLIKVDNYLNKNIPPGIFITVFLAIYDVSNKSINMVSAGHNPLLLYEHKNRNIRKINPDGMPLGVPVTLGVGFSERLEEVTINLNEGDVFLIYTDGITEAKNRHDEQYGLKRLNEFMKKELVNGSIKHISDFSKALVTELDDFTGFLKNSDDISFIVAKCTDKKTVENKKKYSDLNGVEAEISAISIDNDDLNDKKS